MTEQSYIIIPGCCDLNRGDQALGWETRHIAEDAGFAGSYSILAETGEPIQQSKDEGYEVLVPVLEHPSRKFGEKNNIIYDKKTKVKWGFVALKDLIGSLMLLLAPCRALFMKFSHNQSVITTLQRFRQADAIFMKGGGLIQSHGGLMSTYATYYRLYHIFLAECMGKPVYILPNSFGPFEGPCVKWMVRKAFSRCSIVTARERKSQEVVKRDLGMDIPLFPDLAFYLRDEGITRNELCQRMSINPEMKIVALTMRPYRFPYSPDPRESYEKFKREMRAFILWLHAQGYMPLLVEHTFAITSHENDGECIRDVIEGLPEDMYRVLSDHSMNCRQLKKVYGCCDYIVGTRFHSMIFSLCNEVPGIAISYDGYKSIGIMRDMNLSEYVIDIADVTDSRLESMFCEIVNNESQIKDNIRVYIRKANDERSRLIELMRSKKGDE